MEPMSASLVPVATIIQLISFFKTSFHIYDGNSGIAKEATDLIARLERLKALLEFISSDVDFGVQEFSTSRILDQLRPKLTDIQNEMARLIEKRQSTAKSMADDIKRISTTIESLEISLHGIRDIYFVSKLGRMDSYIRRSHQILGLVAELFDSSTDPVHGMPEDGNSIQGDRDNRVQRLETIRAKLHETLGAMQVPGPSPDPLCFPFVPTSPGSDKTTIGQVKLDTGASDNWISISFLERASIVFSAKEFHQTYIGANGEPFSPIGEARLTWYSTNQALTYDTCFLVHGQLPFDVVLGSTWILSKLDSFHEHVLPLRHILSRNDFRILRRRQEETDASNEDVIKLQQAQNKAKREQKRKEKAESRAMSLNVTPSALSRQTSVASMLSRTTIATQTRQPLHAEGSTWSRSRERGGLRSQFFEPSSNSTFQANPSDGEGSLKAESMPPAEDVPKADSSRR